MTQFKLLMIVASGLLAPAAYAQVPDSVPAAQPTPQAMPNAPTGDAPSPPAKPKAKPSSKARAKATPATSVKGGAGAQSKKTNNTGAVDLSKVAADIDAAAAGVTSKIKADPKTAKALDDLNNINKK